jgi:hypothetical protein
VAFFAIVGTTEVVLREAGKLPEEGATGEVASRG